MDEILKQGLDPDEVDNLISRLSDIENVSKITKVTDPIVYIDINYNFEQSMSYHDPKRAKEFFIKFEKETGLEFSNPHLYFTLYPGLGYKAYTKCGDKSIIVNVH